LLGVFILLINPVITSKNFEINKTPLPIVMDNSSSIVDLKANKTALEAYSKLISNKSIQDKFEIQSYQFDTDFQLSEKFNFKGKQTNIDKVAKNLKSINKNSNYPVVLISDGNQTIGNDYLYSFEPSMKIYPVVLGDTTSFLDLRISHLNVNKYAFLKNKFPVEVF